jgi:hypothetical protein
MGQHGGSSSRHLAYGSAERLLREDCLGRMDPQIGRVALMIGLSINRLFKVYMYAIY